MKKILVSAILILGLSQISKAQDMPVAEVIKSSITFNIVACSSSAATLVYSTYTTNNIGMPDRKFIAMQDLDTSNYICIGSDPGMSCTALSMVIPENRALVSIPLALFKEGGYQQEVINLYCKTSSTTGSSNLVVIQGK